MVFSLFYNYWLINEPLICHAARWPTHVECSHRWESVVPPTPHPFNHSPAYVSSPGSLNKPPPPPSSPPFPSSFIVPQLLSYGTSASLHSHLTSLPPPLLQLSYSPLPDSSICGCRKVCTRTPSTSFTSLSTVGSCSERVGFVGALVGSSRHESCQLSEQLQHSAKSSSQLCYT